MPEGEDKDNVFSFEAGKKSFLDRQEKEAARTKRAVDFIIELQAQREKLYVKLENSKEGPEKDALNDLLTEVDEYVGRGIDLLDKLEVPPDDVWEAFREQRPKGFDEALK